MELEQTTEVAISGHAQKVGTLAAQLGYEGALTLVHLKMKLFLSTTYC
jgi:hypothetical protein